MHALTVLKKRGSCRTLFDQAAGEYHEARPKYPERLFDDLLTAAAVEGPPRVLEIGAGTGQATLPLLERGCAVVAIELGPRLAARAGAPTSPDLGTRRSSWAASNQVNLPRAVASMSSPPPPPSTGSTPLEIPPRSPAPTRRRGCGDHRAYPGAGRGDAGLFRSGAPDLWSIPRGGAKPAAAPCPGCRDGCSPGSARRSKLPGCSIRSRCFATAGIRPTRPSNMRDCFAPSPTPWRWRRPPAKG